MVISSVLSPSLLLLLKDGGEKNAAEKQEQELFVTR